jgi:1-acyl-sn-glycerol-3-phosphate acyltransferase
VACADGLRVRVAVLPPVASEHADRRALAGHLQELIAAELGGPVAAAGASAGQAALP